VGGEAGVARVLQLLRDELASSLSLLGIKSLDELNPDLLVRA
jgi:isopentenyl diphosphate isomerase/L-lactate dehydrogenase-like FMN-dependent dehydrogenase